MMSQAVKSERDYSKVPTTVKADNAMLAPNNMKQAWDFAESIHRAGMAPAGMDTVDQIMVAMTAGLELGLPPMAAIQSVAVINGRPCLWGDALIGVVRSSPLCRYVREWIDGEGDQMVAYCETHRENEAEPVKRSFSVFDAQRAGLWQTEPIVTRTVKGSSYKKRNDSPWWKYPKRMLQMRARSWCLRDVYADILKGIQIREEVEDYTHNIKETPVERPTILKSLTAGKPANSDEGFDRHHLEAEAEELSTGENNANTDETLDTTTDNEEQPVEDVVDHNFDLTGFLKELAVAVISVSEEGEVKVVKTSKLYANSDLTSEQSKKARDVVTIAREISKNEIEYEDGLKRIAGVIGVDYREIEKELSTNTPDQHATNEVFVEEQWLGNLARQLAGAIGDDVDEYNRIADHIYPSKMTLKLTDEGNKRAQSIYNYGLQACKKEIPLDQAKKLMAGVAKIDDRELLK